MKHSFMSAVVGVAFALFGVTAAAQPAALQRVGVAAGITGDVRLASATVPSARPIGAIRSGQDVFLGDRVATGPSSQMQIMLLDQTVFTIGPDASVTIDEFVFDPGTGRGKLSAAVSGSFRFVTGRIANTNPADMKVRVPLGTMGIRGTVVAGVGAPDYALIVLLGPGPENNAAERIGRLFVEADAPGQPSVELRRPGFATELNGPGQAPVEPFRIEPERLGRLLSQFDSRLMRGTRATAGDSDEAVAATEPAAGGGGSATSLSGNGLASGLAGVTSVPGLGFGRPNSDQPDQLGSGIALPNGGVFDGTTFRELAEIGLSGRGSSVFPAQTFALHMGDGPTGAAPVKGGTYTLAMTIDFAQRQTQGSVVLNLTQPFPIPGRVTFPVATQYSADGRPNFGPDDPGLQEVRRRTRSGSGELTLNYVPLNANGAQASQLLSGVIFKQHSPAGKEASAYGAGVSTTSGVPIAADAATAFKTLKLPPPK